MTEIPSDKTSTVIVDGASYTVDNALNRIKSYLQWAERNHEPNEGWTLFDEDIRKLIAVVEAAKQSRWSCEDVDLIDALEALDKE